MPVRMKDVARDLNVSVVTVSKALRDQSDLNHQPNWIARSLVSGRTHTIGLGRALQDTGNSKEAVDEEVPGDRGWPNVALAHFNLATI